MSFHQGLIQCRASDHEDLVNDLTLVNGQPQLVVSASMDGKLSFQPLQSDKFSKGTGR